MPLPQLNTNVDYSNALNNLAAQEQNRRRYEEAVAFRNQQAEGQNELRRMQMEGLQDERQSRAEERESRNALRVHQENKLKLGLGKSTQDMMASSIAMVSSLDDYKEMKDYYTKLGAPAYMFPDLKSDDELKEYKSRVSYIAKEEQKGTEFVRVDIYGPGGETRVAFTKKGEEYVPPKGWTTTKPKEDTSKATPKKDWGKISTTIMLQSDDPDLVKDYVYQYNQEAPGHDVFVVETKEGWKVPGLGWKGGKDESKIVRKTLPKINGMQLSRDDVAAYAESRGVTHEEAIERIMKFNEKEPSKSTEPTKSGSTTRSY